MANKNPFAIGDSVLCSVDLNGSPYVSTNNEQLPLQVSHAPKRGEELVVDGVHRNLIRFRKYDTQNLVRWWPHAAFVAAGGINAEIEALL